MASGTLIKIGCNTSTLVKVKGHQLQQSTMDFLKASVSKDMVKPNTVPNKNKKTQG